MNSSTASLLGRWGALANIAKYGAKGNAARLQGGYKGYCERLVAREHPDFTPQDQAAIVKQMLSEHGKRARAAGLAKIEAALRGTTENS